MANGFYVPTKEALLNGDLGDLDSVGVSVKVVLIDTALYTVNLTTDAFLADIASGARIATSGALSSKSITNGVFDAADVTISGVSGSTVEAYAVYIDTGNTATSQLLTYVDTESDGTTPIALTPNGGDVVVQFDNGSNRIFRLN